MAALNMPHLLLLLPSLSYRGEAFLEAAAKVGVSLTVGGESAPDFLVHSPGGFLPLDLHDSVSAVSAAVEFSNTRPIDVVLGVNDNTTVLASRISAALGLPSNSIDSVCAARNKHTMRELLRKHGLPTPHVVVYGIDEIPEDMFNFGGEIESQIGKLFMHGSNDVQGVARAIEKIWIPQRDM